MKLLDICEAIVDCEHKTAPTVEDGEYFVIRTPDIGRGRLNIDQARKVTKETYLSWTRRMVPQLGDLVFAREAPVGNVALILEGQQICLGQRTVLIRPNKSKVNPVYLCLVLLSDEMQATILAKAAGATVPHVNMADIRALEIPQLPDISTQDRFAWVFSAYDDLIALNQRRIQLLEESARLLYREWLVKLRFPGYESVPVKDGVPEGWQMTRLARIADVNRASLSSKDKPEFILYVDISTVNTGEIGEYREYTFEDTPGRARRKVAHGDIIWSCVRPNRRSYALIWEPDERLIVSTGFAVITATALPFSYLYLATTTDEFVGYLEKHATGAAYPAVTGKDFENAPILLPKKETLNQFDGLVLPMLEQVEILKRQNRELRQARDLLLPKLMSGALDVSRIALPDEANV